MGRLRSSWALLLSAATGISCGEQRPAVIKKPAIPLFVAADSVVFRVPEALVRSGQLIGAYALSDTVVAIVSTAPGGVALVQTSGAYLGSPKGLGSGRPTNVARCTQGGIAIVTAGDRRVFVISPSGVAAEGPRIPASLGTVLGAQYENGRDLVALVDGAVPETQGAALVRVGAALVRISQGQHVDTIGSFPGRELLRLSAADSGFEPPFGVATRFAAGPTRLYLAATNEATIQEYQTNGRRLAAIDIVRERSSVSRRQIDSALTASGHADKLPIEAREALLDAMTRERTVPLWKTLVVDPDENIWATSYEPPDKDGDRAWMVYAADGTRKAKIFLPHDFDVTEVGRTYVLGVFRSAPPAGATRWYGLQLLGGR